MRDIDFWTNRNEFEELEIELKTNHDKSLTRKGLVMKKIFNRKREDNE